MITQQRIQQIIRNRTAQGFSARAIAHQIEKETRMQEQHLCKDCHQPMEVIEQPLFKGGNLILLTCKNPNCLLETVTLSSDQFASLNEDQLEAYRKMNRQRRSEGR